jgi:hypothetical protein
METDDMSMLPFDGTHPTIPLKVCRTCREKKPMEAFANHSHYRDNKHSVCKKCSNEILKELNRIKRNQGDCPKPADGLCECCKQDPTKFDPPRKWIWDHDHESEKFRGWLCNICNLSIGQLGDSVEGLMNAVRYWERAKDRKPEIDLFED